MVSFNGDQLRHFLSINESLPRPSVAPLLSYGRHRGPAPRHSRVAAVAIALFQNPGGEWTIPLTLRPSQLQHHGGQVCLPGGRVEADEDVHSAAMREFAEELGVTPRIKLTCGELSTQYVYASNNLVHPMVVVIEPPDEPWSPDPVEVEKVIPVPLQVFLGVENRIQLVEHRAVQSGGSDVDRFSFRAPAFRHQEHTIWGATALILDQLAQILQRL